MRDFKFNNIYAINFINLNNSDAMEVLNMRNDSKIAKYMISERKISQCEHLNFIANLKWQQNCVYFAIKENDLILGSISLNNIDLCNKNAFIGIYVNPNMQHKGIGSKLMCILKYIAFDELSLHILFAKCISINTYALKFYEKEGFLKCGILPQAIKKDNNFIDIEILAFKKD